MRIGASLPILNQPYDNLPRLALAAEEAGLDSVWSYEFYRNPFTIHALCAQATSSITLGIGIAETVARTPFEMANGAADVDELSGGRTLLGMGTGGGGLELFHGLEHADKPVTRMREFTEAVELSWHHHATGEPVSSKGAYHSVTSPPINPWGVRPLARPRIPIYLAALRPRMLALAGRVADGALGILYTPSFVAEHVRPNIAVGAAEAGRDPGDVQIASYVICSCSEDREEAWRRARIQVGNYVAPQVSEVVVDHMGLQADRMAVLEAFMAGGPQALEHATSDELVRTFSITGTPDECREQLKQYEGVLDHIILHTPYVPPLNADESEDAFLNNVRALGRGASGPSGTMDAREATPAA